MKWRDVTVGMVLLVKGEEWTVTAHDGNAVTMTSRLGERTGEPDPDAEVEVIRQPKPDPWEEVRPHAERAGEELERYERALKAAAPKPPPDPELARLREFAVSEGFRRSEVERLELTDLRRLIHQRRVERLAKDNGVSTRAVEDILVRLTLGATVIADLHTSEPPSTPMVDVMDVQMMRNHLALFHNEYPPQSEKLDRLVALHEQLADVERHTHDLRF